jgi:hypothetical protein
MLTFCDPVVAITGTLDPDRTHELTELMKAAGIPV